MKPTTWLLASLLAAAGSASAAVTLTDNGLTTPTGFTTGFTGTGTPAFNGRYSFDAGDSHGQSFTTGTSGNLKYLDIAYNAGGVGTFEVYIDTAYADGGAAEAGAAGNLRATIDLSSLGANGLSGDSTNVDGALFYWFRLDFSTESIALVANQQAAFFFNSLTEGAGDDSNFIFAPHYKTLNPYSGGDVIQGFGGPVAGSDFGFAVTVVPEPSAALLGGLGTLALLRRRRA